MELLFFECADLVNPPANSVKVGPERASSSQRISECAGSRSGGAGALAAPASRHIAKRRSLDRGLCHRISKMGPAVDRRRIFVGLASIPHPAGLTQTSGFVSCLTQAWAVRNSRLLTHSR